MATRTALFCLCPAGKGALEVRQVPRRHPAAGEVEIAVEAAGFGERSAWKELTPISEGFYGMALERRAPTKNNENQSVCDRFSIVYLLYWNFLPRLGKLLNTRWNFELGDGDARFWSAHGTSTNPFEEGRSTEKLRFPPQEAYGE